MWNHKVSKYEQKKCERKIGLSKGALVTPSPILLLNKGSKSPRPIIVRFSNYYSKEQMYRGRWKLRKKSSLRGLRVDPKNVYINENLTAYRAGLFKKVRDRRRRDWKFWTTDGKMFVKPDPIRDVIVKIQSEEDLNKL